MSSSLNTMQTTTGTIPEEVSPRLPLHGTHFLRDAILRWRWVVKARQYFSHCRKQKWFLPAASLAAALLVFVGIPSWASVGSGVKSWQSISLTLPPELDAIAPSVGGRILDQGVYANPSLNESWETIEVRSGQTMSDIFSGLGLSSSVLHRVVNTSKHGKNLASIKPGDQFSFLIPEPGRLAGLQFDSSEITRVILKISDQAVNEEIISHELESRVHVASGVINGSLFGAGESAGLSDRVIMDLANIFGYDIDFALDIRKGDRFSVIYEKLYRDGELVRDGNVLAASFDNRGKHFEAVRHTLADGRADYFSPDGRSLRKAFLRTPLEFSRISSRFSSGRRHPILGKTRAHRGVDYAAPSGTAVRAAGSGKVIFRGWKSGYGNTIILQHGKTNTTLYGHLSRFAGGVHNGGRVDQGQLIGHVGMTGLATGPHLHYEFRVSGVHRDPLKIDLPKPEPLLGAQLAQFRSQAAPLFKRLALLNEQSQTRLLAHR